MSWSMLGGGSRMLVARGDLPGPAAARTDYAARGGPSREGRIGAACRPGPVKGTWRCRICRHPHSSRGILSRLPDYLLFLAADGVGNSRGRWREAGAYTGG